MSVDGTGQGLMGRTQRREGQKGLGEWQREGVKRSSGKTES